MTDNQIPSPLFAHVEPGPRFAIRDITRLLARTGISEATANARAKNYVNFKHIHVREKGNGGGGSPNLFALVDLAAAILISAVQDAGVQDREALKEISTGLYCGWRADAQQTTPHPVLAAALETVNDIAMWQLQVDFYRHLQTNERRIIVNLYRAGEIDPNTAPPVSDAERRLLAEHPDAQIDRDYPATSPNYWPSASLLIPAFQHLQILRPIIAPSWN